MYRVGRDKRKLISAGLICDGLNGLLKKTAFQNISVTAIVEAAGVGRTTFYRLFDDKTDVILYQTETLFDGIIERERAAAEPSKNHDVSFVFLFEFWLKRRELFLALIDANLYESFQNRLAVIVEKKLSFLKQAVNIDDRGWKYFINIRASMLFTALKVAVLNYQDDTAADIAGTLSLLFGNKPEFMRETHF
ncbi:MAG: TetR/AcrR family transcriptional regulator [Clostridiales bacterium]|nr:TetR/AcrR family transcriptional regulator [Clostridiales bacterium]